jgi:hypothetical protein
MVWVGWALGAVAALLAVDRLATWAEAHGWVYWRKRQPGQLPGGGILGDFVEVFQPARRHVVQERDRHRLGAHLLSSDGAPPGVDLDRGTVRLTGSPSSARRSQSSGPPAT